MKKQIIAIVCGLACLLGTAGCGSAAGEAKQEKSEAKSEASRTVTKAEDKAEDKAENKTEEKTEDKSTEESKSLVSAATPLDNKKSTETVPLSEDTRYQELRQYIIDNFEGDEGLNRYRGSDNKETESCMLLDQLEELYIGCRENYPDLTNEQYTKLLEIRKKYNWNRSPSEEADVLGLTNPNQSRVTLDDARRIVGEAEKLSFDEQADFIYDEFNKIRKADIASNPSTTNSYKLFYKYILDDGGYIVLGRFQDGKPELIKKYISVEYFDKNQEGKQSKEREVLFDNYEDNSQT